MAASPAPETLNRTALTPAEFAAFFGRRHLWARRMIQAGLVHAFRLGTLWIPFSEVERCMSGQGIKPATKRSTRRGKGASK